MYKSCTMRLAFVAIDRPEIGYVSKELCRAVSRPTQHAWEHLKHAARYLQHRPRVQWVYASQRPPAVVDAFSDSDFAGCRTSRRSTSGTVVRVGLHTISRSSSTQGTIALSSTESEFYAAVRSACRGLGVKQLAAGLGTALGLRAHTDSSGALGLASRRGAGGARHIATPALWLQEAVASGLLDLRRVKGTLNVADLMTKVLSGEDTVRLLHMMGFSCPEGVMRFNCGPRFERGYGRPAEA